MPFPEYIATRTCSVGGAATIESNRLLKIRATLSATKSLIWDDTGFQFLRWEDKKTSTLGSQVSFTPPRTDLQGWKDFDSKQLIDTSAEGSFSHQYLLLVEYLDENDNAIGIAPTVLGPFVVPDGVGELDLDKTVVVGTIAGDQVSIPDSWDAKVAAAEAAAVAAQAALVDSAQFVADQIGTAGTPANLELNTTIVEAVEAATVLPSARTPQTATVIVAHGDSITEIGIGADSYVERLGVLTGLQAVNNGKWGRSAPQTAAAQGGAPTMLTFPSNTIQASGAATVTVPSSTVNPLGGSYNGSLTGKAHGIAGTLSWVQATDVLTFTRTTSGSAIALTGAVKFIPDVGAAVANREAIQIFAVGRNGVTDVNGNVAAIRAMAGYGNSRFLVLSILTWVGQTNPAASNYALQEAFPDQYVDLLGWLMTPAAATAAGITFDSNDNADIAAGLVPRALRVDDVHPNAYGRKAIAAYLFQVMVARGWVAAYTAPTLPVAATNRWDLSGRGPGQPVATAAPLVGLISLTQADTTKQPIGIVDSAFKRSALAFDGTDLIAGTLAGMPTVATGTIVARITDAVDANGKLFANLFGVLLRVNANKVGTYSTSGGSSIASTHTADTLPHVFTVVLNGATSAVWVDGVKLGTGTTLISNANAVVGGGALIQVEEFIYHDSVVSDANIAALSTALRAAYVV